MAERERLHPSALNAVPSNHRTDLPVVKPVHLETRVIPYNRKIQSGNKSSIGILQADNQVQSVVDRGDKDTVYVFLDAKVLQEPPVLRDEDSQNSFG